MVLDIVLNGLFEFFDACKATVSNALDGEVAKESFDHIEPGRTGRRVMDLEAWVLCEPCGDVLLLVRGVVIGNQMDLAVAGVASFNLFQEL